MATESLVIRIRADGTRIVSRDISRIGQSARQTSRQVGDFQRSINRLASAFGALAVVRLADSFTELQNKIRVLVADTNQVNEVTRQLLQVSNDTRTAVAGNARIFQRLIQSTDSLGVSIQDAVDITKSLGQALVISGATAAEAQGGMIQLSQGLAFGSLRAEELRTVLEQLPEVTKVLQRELGVTRGGLQILGEQGRITTEVIIRAFKEARGELEERFSRTIPTVGQAFVVLQNAVTGFLGEMNKATGIFGGFSNLIIDIAKNIDIFGRVAIGLVLVPAILKLNAVLSTTLTIASLFRAGLLLGVGQLIAFSDQIRIAKDSTTTLADVAAGTFDAFVDEISKLGPNVAEVGKQLGLLSTEFNFEDVTFKDLAVQFGVAMDAILGTAKGTISALIVLFEGLPKLIEAAISDVGRVGQKPIEDAIKDAQKRLSDAVKEFGPVLPASVQASIDKQFDAISRRVPEARRQKALNEVAAQNFGNIPADEEARINKEFGPGPTTVSEVTKKFQEIGEASAAAFEKGVLSTNIASTIIERGLSGGNKRSAAREIEEEKNSQADLNEERKKGNELLTASDLVLADFNRKIDAEGKAVRQSADERKVLEQRLRTEEALRTKNVDITKANVQAELALMDQKRAANIVAERQQKILDRFNMSTERQIETVSVLLPLMDGSIQKYAQLAKATDRATLFGRDFNAFLLGELSLGLEQTLDQLTSLSGSISGTLVGALDKASDALFEFARSGFKDVESLKEAFSNLFADLGREITRFIVRLIVLKTLSAILNSGGGTGDITQDFSTNELSSNTSGPFALRQAGGFLGRGRPAIVGERGPELFVPTENGRVVPNSQAGGQPQVIVTPVIVDDPDEVANFLATEAGADAVISVIQKRRRQLKGAF